MDRKRYEIIDNKESIVLRGRNKKKPIHKFRRER